jgi:hypothetical protein
VGDLASLLCFPEILGEHSHFVAMEEKGKDASNALLFCIDLI